MSEPSAPSEHQRKLQEIIAAYLEAEADGHAPEAEAWLAEHAEFADELRQFLADHQRMEKIGQPLREATGPIGPKVGELPGELPTMDSAKPGGAAEPALPKIRYFGDYELLEEIARGGMGVVYKARQVKLGRVVAVKMILAGHLAGGEDVERFYTEARAAAKLHHPNIVAIHEVGEHDGQHYFSMDYVPGQSLAERIARGPLPAREAAELIRTVAAAVSFAHVESVIHRDLKPANILLDGDGQPHVTDFGLAKQVGEYKHDAPASESSRPTQPADTLAGASCLYTDSLAGASGSYAESSRGSLTATGQVLGTPSYMPPEQASGKTAEIGPRSDVYSLGAVLYCALTGHPPFQAASPLDTLLQVIEGDPPPPRTLNSAVPRDLETICLKCLEKDSARRYASAQELADDLERFLDGQPIKARRATRLERLAKWVRRRPAAAALIGVSVAAAIGLAALGIGLIVNARRLAAAERQRADLLDAQISTARSHHYSSDIVQAAVAHEKQNAGVLQEYLSAWQPGRGEEDLRGFEWYYLWKQNNPARVNLPTMTIKPDGYSLNHSEYVDARSDRNRLVFSPDGKLVATRSNVCDVATAERLIEYDECSKVLFSPDSRFLSAGTIIVDLASKKKRKLPLAPKRKWFRNKANLVVFPAESEPLGFLAERNALVVLHQGERTQRPGFLETAIESEVSVKSYDAATGKETEYDVKVREGYRIVASAFCEKRGLLAIATATSRDSSRWVEKDEVEVWDLLKGGRKLVQLDRLDKKARWGNDELHDVLFAPDGTLAVITRDHVIRLCDPMTGEERHRLATEEFHGWRYSTFSRDSKTFVALGWTKVPKLRIWDVASGKELANRDVSFAGSMGNLGRQPEAAISPDGKTYATGGGTKVVQLWDTATGDLKTTFLGHKHPVRELTFSPDGNMLATLDVERKSPKSESNVKLWHAAGEKPIGLPVDTSAVTVLARSPDGATLAVGFANGKIRLCDAATLKVQSVLHNQSSKIHAIQFSPDGKQLAASHRGESVYVVAKKKYLDVWDIAGGKVTASFPGFLRAFDGKVVAAISTLAPQSGSPPRDDTITIWNAATGERVSEVKDAIYKRLAIAPDGQTAVTVLKDGKGNDSSVGLYRYKVWNTADGTERLEPPRWFQGRCTRPSFLRFSPDGKYCAVGDEIAVVPPGVKYSMRSAGRLYDMATGKEHAFFPLAHLHRDNYSNPKDDWTLAEFSHDGKLLVTVSNEPNAMRAKVTLWDVAAGKEKATLPNGEKYINAYAVLSPDGKTLATMTLGKWVRDHFPGGKWDAKGKIRIERADPKNSGTSGGTGGLSSIHPVYEVHVWDVATLKRRERFIVSWKGDVESMAFSGDGKSIYTVISNPSGLYRVPTVNRLQVWDVKTGEERGSLGNHGERFHAITYAADGRLLALTEQRLNVRRPPDYPSSYKIRTWDVTRQRELGEAKTFTAMQLPLDLDPESLAVAPNTPSKKDAWSDAFSFGSHNSTAVSPDGKVKAVRGYKLPLHTTGPDGKPKVVPSPTDIAIVDTATGEVLHVLKSYGQWVTRLAFSPDGKTLAVGESSGKIRLWNVAAGRLLLTLPGHSASANSGSVNGLAFHPDGRVLASCSDSEIRLWRAATDKEVARREQ